MWLCGRPQQEARIRMRKCFRSLGSLHGEVQGLKVEGRSASGTGGEGGIDSVKRTKAHCRAHDPWRATITRTCLYWK